VPLASAQSANEGFVVYHVSITNIQGHSYSFSINESVSPSSESGFSAISIAYDGVSTNFSISKIVNTTALPELFPIIPGISNESGSFSRNGTTFNGAILNTGSSNIVFGGSNYVVSDYSVTASIVNSTRAASLSGTLRAMPSGILYSADFVFNGTSTIDIQLLSTNLPLAYASVASAATGATIVGVGIVGAAALAFPFWNLAKKRTSEQTDREKPPHWVD
jgi:hypothetical protein